ncbi:MAG: peptidoglycan-binding lipoprotein, OmpA family, partial [Deltaproteobacteria bacterium]|nr:peptidoglycan-binding lipoprotein, OmpA family [Deltaproteobacteria bacterium]
FSRCIVLVAATSVTFVAGCAHMEKSPPERKTGYAYIHQPLPEASRKVDAARAAGKDKQCPAEFNSAKDTVDNAYAIYIACRTQEGIAMAQDGINKLNALCPAKMVEVVPPPPAPKPVPPPPAPKPVPPAPTATIAISPSSIIKGESATLSWSSQNANDCTINQAVGKVQPQGSMSISPADNTSYAISCTGEGGMADSSANVAVKPPPKRCSPAVLDIHFDTDKSDIKPEYHGELQSLADFLTEFPKATGVIEGYTDSTASRKYNVALSQRRADSVRDYLIKKLNIAPERISAKGFGPDKPVGDNKTAAGRKMNRRIETNFNCN